MTTYPDFMENPNRGCAPRNKVDANIFFANPREDATPQQKQVAARLQAKAKRICSTDCPFTRDCFVWATTHSEEHGVWGAVNMANAREVAAARVQYSVVVVEAAVEPEPVGETDDVMVERVLGAGRAAYQKLTDEQRASVIREGVRRGFSLNVLSRQFRTSTRAMRALAGDVVDGFDQKVRRLYHEGKSDSAIAVTLDCDPKSVWSARVRLGLPALFGPGGSPRRRASEAQKATLVGASA